MREGEAKARLGRDLRGRTRSPQHERLGRGRCFGPRLQARIARSGRMRTRHEAEQVRHLLRVGKRARLLVVERATDALVPARRAAEAQVDAAGEQRFKKLVVLRDLEAAVIGKQHPARADADARGARGDMRHQDLGRVAGGRRDPVVLGHPVAVEAFLLGQLGQPQRGAKGIRRRLAFIDRRVVQQAEAQRRGVAGLFVIGARFSHYQRPPLRPRWGNRCSHVRRGPRTRWRGRRGGSGDRRACARPGRDWR